MTTYSEVKDAFAQLDDTDVHHISGINRTVVTTHENNAGQLFKTLRVNGFNAQSKRLGDTLVSHIESEREGLGELFG